MFNIGFSELILILVIAYVFVGPQDLPKVARWLGRRVRDVKQIIREVKTEVGWDEVVNEAKGVQKEVKDVQKEVEGTVKGNDLRKELQEVTKDFDDVKKTFGKEVRDAEKDTFKGIKKGS